MCLSVHPRLLCPKLLKDFDKEDVVKIFGLKGGGGMGD
jgi:hypothetical protein